MVEHFPQANRPRARDRIHRAYATGLSRRDCGRSSLSARRGSPTPDYVYDDLPGLARHVAEALAGGRARLTTAARCPRRAGGRAGLPLGRGAPTARSRGTSRAHEHATAEGDDTTLSALLKNRAWISGNQARMASIFGPELFPADASALRHAQMSAESSEHFDAHLGHTALRSLGPVMRAQLLVAQGRYEDALVALQQHLAVSQQEGSDYTRPVLQADIAWCQINLGRPDAALASAHDAEGSFVPDCEEEDRAAAHGRLRQVYTALKMDAEAGTHAREAHVQLEALRAEQVRLVALLDAALKHVK
jgi:hypothetical protein